MRLAKADVEAVVEVYSPSVTMVVCVAILEIFSVKKWPDLEIWVWGPSGSLICSWFGLWTSALRN